MLPLLDFKRVFVILAMAAVGAAGCSEELQWSTVDYLINTEYPEVRQISTDSLAIWLQEPETPVLLDARASEEYAVSHLMGAVWLDPETADFSSLDSLPRDAPLVIYCSVGYRSAALAQRLTEAGFTDVLSLQGSIFQWANEDRPVYRHGIPVRQVHPFDRLWGQLLRDDLRTTRPLPPG